MPLKRQTDKGPAGRFARFPLVFTLIIVVGITVFTILGKYGVSLCLGVASGGLLFSRGAIAGGRLGNARQGGQAGTDINMRVGACLALAGIAAGAQGHDPVFAWPERILIGMGQVAASGLAVGLAGQAAKQNRAAKETRAADETAAKLL